jgi:hypothetical protein
MEVRFGRPLRVRTPAFQVAAGLLRCQVFVNGVPWQWEPSQVRLEKIWINGESDDGFPGGQLRAPWGIIFPLLLVYGVVFFPITVLLIGLAEYIRELRLKSRLRQRGRVVDWADVKRRTCSRAAHFRRLARASFGSQEEEPKIPSANGAIIIIYLMTRERRC